MNITDVKTIYFDSEALHLQPYRVGRVKLSESGRAYFKYELPARIFTSLTTVISTCTPTPYGLLQWKMRYGEKESNRLARVAAMYGTMMHSEIGTFCINQQWNFDTAREVVDDFLSENQFYDPDTADWHERLKEDMQAWADFVYRDNVKVLAVEMVLCSEAYQFATAIDIVCMMDVDAMEVSDSVVYASGPRKGQPKEVKVRKRIRGIINMKSGRHGFYQENANQLELERMVWNENYPEMPVEHVFNWAPTDWREVSGDKYKLKDQSGKANKIEMEAMLMLASERYKGENERKMWTNITGEVYYGNDPTTNITQLRVIDHLTNIITNVNRKNNP